MILYKSDSNINIISNTAKNILRTIENIGSQYLGQISISNQFKFKYYEHNYDDCRILVTKNEDSVNDYIFKHDRHNNCRCYYSNRYINADNFRIFK